jgi:Arc/MetJ-type ribon-helix-helix transcriptional regulator
MRHGSNKQVSYSITTALPEPLRRKLEVLYRDGGFKGVAELVRELLNEATDRRLLARKTVRTSCDPFNDPRWEGCICLQDEHHKDCPAIQTGKCHYQSLYCIEAVYNNDTPHC